MTNCSCSSNLETVAIKKLNDNIEIPKYQHPTDAGCDLVASENYLIKPGEIKLFGTGIAIKLPQGYEAQIRPRSGLSVKHGVTVINSPGTIDCNYTGEIKVGLINHSDTAYYVSKGDRIAQMVLAPVYHMIFKETNVLEVTDRGDGGFNSTGK